MVNRIAARSFAILMVLSPFVFGSPVAALAQAPLAPMRPLSQASVATEPFGLPVEPVMYGDVLSKWNGVVAEIGVENDILVRCRQDGKSCPAAAQKFLAAIADGRARDGRARVGVINRAINMAIRPMSDMAQWGVPDRWSAPLATLASGRSDCEDYAIAKYVALREAGVAEDDVRLVIVRDLANGEDHAVVIARLDERWIVLDNRRLALVVDTDMPRVRPLFVFDRDGVKRFTPPTAVARRTQAPVDGAAAAPSALGL
jgi:predicted transglutaminase-like cysteine proteinase